MSYFLSKIFNGVKLGCATLGIIMSGSVILYGLVTKGAAFYIIGGTVFCCVSAFNCFDSSKVVMDIKKEINKIKAEISEFKLENNQLSNNIDELEMIKDNYVKELEKINKQMKKSEKFANELKLLKDDYEHQNQLLNDALEKSQFQLVDFKDQVEELNKTKENIVVQNVQLQSNIKLLSKDIQELEFTKITYQQQLDKLNTENADLKESLTKLHKIYNDTKTLMVQLATLGDEYNQFAANIDASTLKLDEKIDTITSATNNIDNVSNQLDNLLTKLKDTKFNELDENNDGVISMSEFEEGLLKK